MRAVALLILLLSFIACEKVEPAATASPGRADNVPPNKAPVAVLPADTILYFPAVKDFTITGTASYDPDGRPEELLYAWVEFTGKSTFYSAANARVLEVSLPDTGRYVFGLRVTDRFGASSWDTMYVSVRVNPDCNPNLERLKIDGLEEYLIPGPVSNMASIAYDEQYVVLAGGATDVDWSGAEPYWFNFSNSIWVYSLAGRTASRFELSEARGEMAVDVQGGKAVLAGGKNEKGLSDVVDLLDLSTGRMKTLKMPNARSGLKVMIAGDEILFVGGFTGLVLSAVVDVYNMSNGTWTSTNLSEPYHFANAVRWEGKVYFIGEDRILVYDSMSRTWKTHKTLMHRAGASAALLGSELFLIGGWGMGLHSLERIELSTMSSTTECLPDGASNQAVGHDSKYISYTGYQELNRYDVQSRTWGTGSMPYFGKLISHKGKPIVLHFQSINRSESKVSVKRLTY